MSVISSIVCLLLDPFFRTIAGFQVLIEKEWIAYGYPISWSEEASQYSGSSTEDSLAPISFIQFLDATWQLWTAFPSAFEFTDDFVLFILDNACSSRFGTLECSHDDERFFPYCYFLFLFCSAPSIWSYIKHTIAQFTNQVYSPSSEASLLVNVQDFQSFKPHFWCYCTQAQPHYY